MALASWITDRTRKEGRNDEALGCLLPDADPLLCSDLVCSVGRFWIVAPGCDQIVFSDTLNNVRTWYFSAPEEAPEQAPSKPPYRTLGCLS